MPIVLLLWLTTAYANFNNNLLGIAIRILSWVRVPLGVRAIFTLVEHYLDIDLSAMACNDHKQ